jgi:hypothetical protein
LKGSYDYRPLRNPEARRAALLAFPASEQFIAGWRDIYIGERGNQAGNAGFP